MQRLQLVSPTSTDQGKKADWPTSYDTDTNDGESGQGEYFSVQPVMQDGGDTHQHSRADWAREQAHRVRGSE